MQKEKVLILGFGNAGEHLAASLTNDYHVTGVCRRQKQSVQADILSADCRQQITLQPILEQGFDIIVMTFTPDTITDEGYRRSYVETVNALLATLPCVRKQPRLILFVSSTSVYGQQDGCWVDELSPTVPQHFSGRRLLQAEHSLTMSPWTTCIVRCSGIYGPGRSRLIEQVIAGQGSERESTIISNRIHIDDCAGAIAHLINKQKQVPLANCYLLSDCEPTPLWHVKQWMAKALGLPSDHFRENDKAINSTPIIKRGNKRCCNSRLLSSGYSFIYPSFKEGYEKLLAC
jgi:nucleoside-diphosphate-sugar epimerase